MIPPKKLLEFMEDGTVQIAPLAYKRVARSIMPLILDEAQNTTLNQLKNVSNPHGSNAKIHCLQAILHRSTCPNRTIRSGQNQ
jgi:phosphate starvation-inducible PhoH-like protein